MIVLNSPARGAPIVAVLAVTAFMAACASEMDPSGTTVSTPVESRKTGMGEHNKEMPPQRAPGEERVPAQGTVPPQLLAMFQDDLAQRAQVKRESITVVSATEQQWADGAMGCPQPGMMYAQMIVPGYRVVLQANGTRYAYHSDQRGKFIVCSNGLAFKPVK